MRFLHSIRFFLLLLVALFGLSSGSLNWWATFSAHPMVGNLDFSSVARANATGVVGIITNEVVNIRSGPGTNYGIAGQLRKGEQVEIVGRNAAGDWVRICCSLGATVESWIRVDLITLQFPAGQSITSLPVLGASSAPVAAAPAQKPAAAAIPSAGTYPAPSGINPLTGLALAAGRNSQRPMIVCVNNEVASRPQFGLSQADVVYEYLVEGYVVTRFSAIFYGEDSAQIGPVRSTRLINYDLGILYNALTACSGASDQVRTMMQNQSPAPYMDMDIVDPYSTRYATSIGRDYRTRLRTSSAQMRLWLTEYGGQQPANLRGFTFGSPTSAGAAANTISIPYPRSGAVEYRYDPSTGRYLRYMGGSAYLDGNTSVQLSLDNVIVQIVAHEDTNIIEDSLGSRSVRIPLIGSGRAIVFRQGQAYVGSWRSSGGGDTPHFYDQANAEIPLKPGKTWINVVPTTYTARYQ